MICARLPKSPTPLCNGKELMGLSQSVSRRIWRRKTLELSDALKRYTLASMQQYRTRYLLSKLTQHVDMAYKGIKTPGSLHEYSVLEIEHILPDTPEADSRGVSSSQSRRRLR